jgi:hypothetical protein
MDYRACPNQREAASMLGVSASTLSRARLDGVRRGRRDLRLTPAVLLAANEANHWVPAEELCEALIAYAAAHAAHWVEAVRAEISAAGFATVAPEPSLAHPLSLLEEAGNG